MKLSIFLASIMISLTYMNSDRVNVAEGYTMVSNSTDVFPTASASWYYRLYVWENDFCGPGAYAVICDLPGSECSSSYGGGCFDY